MIAKVLKTGEIVDVFRASNGWAEAFPKEDCLRCWKQDELDFDYKYWESFRHEAAKDILCAALMGGIVRGAVADELIRHLREDEK